MTRILALPLDRRTIARLTLAAALTGPGLASARGQDTAADAALRDRVGQLVERLGGEKAEARDAAEASLIKLGAKALPFLPEPAAAAGEERKARIERIRKAVQAAGPADPGSGPSRVTLKAKAIRLSEAVQQLQKQTGNAITDLREQLGAEATNPAFDLEVDNLTFHEALDEVARKAEVSINAMTGDGSLGIVAGMPMARPMVQYAGPFRVALKQVGITRDFLAGTSVATAQFDIAWEPRLRPMLLSLKSDGIVIQDDKGRDVKPQLMEESNEVVLRPENPVAELNLNLAAPDRSATKLAVVKVPCEVTLPAGLLTFRFPSLAQENVELKQGEVGVRLLNTEVDEQVWKVNVQLSYPGGGPAFESYRQGLFNNRVWLQKADGSRFEQNGGFSGTGSDGGKLGFEYLFVDAPGKPADYGLAYETPSKVETVPLVFEFKDVPLP